MVKSGKMLNQERFLYIESVIIIKLVSGSAHSSKHISQHFLRLKRVLPCFSDRRLK